LVGSGSANVRISVFYIRQSTSVNLFDQV